MVGDIPMRGCPLTEILGNNRVLIENHKGIVAYESNRICVGTCVGVIAIEGVALEIKCITKENLIIIGQIHRAQFLPGVERGCKTKST